MLARVASRAPGEVDFAAPRSAGNAGRGNGRARARFGAAYPRS
jgi:hypothetical protein